MIFGGFCWVGGAGSKGGWSLGMEKPHNTSALDSLNKIEKYDLGLILTDFFGDENEENIFMNDICNHKYYDTNSFTVSVNVCTVV